MERPEPHNKEEERLRELRSFAILDTLPEEDYDTITALAASICETPISLVSLVDHYRQWFKSHHGLSVTETPKEFAFCAHAITTEEPLLVVPDSRKDSRFQNNPLVVDEPHVIFYAGVPLVTENGLPLGTLCVIDNKPRQLSSSQTAALISLGRQVVTLLEFRRKKRQLEQAMTQVEEKSRDLENFAYTAAHDLKAPLRNIHLLAQMLRDELAKNGDPAPLIGMIESSSMKLSRLVDGLLDYSNCSALIRRRKEPIELSYLFEEITGLFSAEENVKFNIVSPGVRIEGNKVALSQILINLISNAIRHNDKPTAEITINFEEYKGQYHFVVTDNGPGIPMDHTEKIFQLFEVMNTKDRYGYRGNGIGLATVKKLVTEMDGQVSVKSQPGRGTTFSFSVTK